MIPTEAFEKARDLYKRKDMHGAESFKVMVDGDMFEISRAELEEWIAAQ